MKSYIFKLQVLFILIIGLSSCNNTETLEELPSNYLIINNNIKIHYKVYGENINSLVFVHGWGCDLNVWKNQFDYFKDKYRLVFIDLPGYGKSDKPRTDYTIDLFAKSVKNVIDDLNIKNPTLVGHSLGFPVCRQVIRNYNDIDSNLCNVDGVYFRFPTDSIKKSNYKKELNDFASLFKGENNEDNVEQFINQLIISKTPKNVKEYAFSTMTKTPKYVGYSTMENLIDEKYWKDDVLEIPTLIVYAKIDELPKDNKNYLQTIFPDAMYYEMEEVGHFLMMEKPNKFNKILEKFIKKNH